MYVRNASIVAGEIDAVVGIALAISGGDSVRAASQPSLV